MTRSNRTSAPEERLLHGDVTSLSNADLLTVLIGKPDAVREVQEAYHTLAGLEDASPTELCELPTLGAHGAARLLAAQELARRRAQESARRGTPILDARDAYSVLEPLLRNETREVVVALALDAKNRLVRPPITISIGTLTSAPVHPRELYSQLIRASACSYILAHLHPSSGETTPSPDDILLTNRVKDAGELIGIPLLDHIIIGNNSFTSLAERGLL